MNAEEHRWVDAPDRRRRSRRIPDVVCRWAGVWPPFAGCQLFLLTWLMVHILDRMRPYVRP